MFKQNSLHMLLCLLPLDLSGHQEKLGSLLTPSHQVFIYIFTTSPNFFARINNPSSSWSLLICQILNPLINFVDLHWITAHPCPSYELLQIIQSKHINPLTK